MADINGGTGNDTLSGTVGDTIRGGGGDDTITAVANFPAHTGPVYAINVEGGTGIDTLVADFRGAADKYANVLSIPPGETSGYTGFFASQYQPSHQLRFSGIDRFVFITGAAGGSWQGGAGNDEFHSGSTLDVLAGGAGNDIYVLSNWQTFIQEKDGEGDADEVRSLAGTVSIHGFDEIERVTGLGSADQVVQGNDAANVIDGGLGADFLRGGKGDDIYIADNEGDYVDEAVGEGIDHVYASANHWLQGNVEKLTSTSTTGIALFGDDGDNIITGSLFAVDANEYGDYSGAPGTGADYLDGGDGNDTFILRAFDSGRTTIEGGAGFDTVDLSQIGTGVRASTAYWRDVEKIIGGAGNDSFYSEGYSDWFEGGAGDDGYMVDSADDVVIEHEDGGLDEVYAAVTIYALTEGSHVELLFGAVESDMVYGPSGWERVPVHYQLTGNSFSNEIVTDNGNDILDGGGGADLMSGGDGNDIYYVDHVHDWVSDGWSYSDASAGGIDEVRASVDHDLAERIETLTSLSTTGIYLGGNDLDNVITGSLFGADGGYEWIDGRGGDDTIIVRSLAGMTHVSGGDGNDTADFSTLAEGGWIDAEEYESVETVLGTAFDDHLTGNGYSILHGGAGNDTYEIRQEGEIQVAEEADGGWDTVFTELDSYTLADNVEELLGTPNIVRGPEGGPTWVQAGQALTGNALDNRIEGGSGDDVIDGGAGADEMRGGGGNDLFIVDHQDDRVAHSGYGDGVTAVEASISFSIAGMYVHNLTLSGSADLDGTGNKGDNVLTGNGGANILDASAGNDILDGGGGADILKGGLGDDLFIVADGRARVREAAGEGFDHVEASVSFSLASQHVEALTLTGSEAIDGTGNGLANTLTGNGAANRLRGGAGNDSLDGGAGADWLHGEAGDDLYIVDAEHDEVVELDGQGHDSIESAVSYSLAGRYVEALTLTGIRSVNATGNSLDNALTGNAAANRLRGGAGDDVLAGGAGKDSLEGGSGADAFVFDVAAVAKNVDRILDFASGEDVIRLDRAVFDAVADGALASSAFALGTAAGEADDRIVYDSATGSLFYDADGSGAGAAMLFATVNAGTLLTAADFTGF